MELETLAENADFDDVDDNDFGEELGGDEFKVGIDLGVTNETKGKEDMDNADSVDNDLYVTARHADLTYQLRYGINYYNKLSSIQEITLRFRHKILSIVI